MAPVAPSDPVDSTMAFARGGLYVRLYKERELDARFGEAYLLCKARTPFFL